jgi:hypothetical protein
MINLTKCAKCGLNLLNLGFGWYSHPPQKDFFGRTQARQCVDYGKSIKITSEPVVLDPTEISLNASILGY